MNTFTKLEDGSWGARVEDLGATTGATVTLTTRSGASKQVTLGAFVRSTAFGDVFAIAPTPRAATATEVVGDLSGIVALFATARRHLKFPAVVLDGFRVNVAGATAREPGSLTVTSVDKVYDRDAERRTYYGRVTLAGVWEPTRAAPEGLGAKLRAFAADPAGVAGAYGRLHGNCCFCRKVLSDERSTAVGYGATCADHYGLPWGARPAAFACEAA